MCWHYDEQSKVLVVMEKLSLVVGALNFGQNSCVYNRHNPACELFSSKRKIKLTKFGLLTPLNRPQLYYNPYITTMKSRFA